MKQLGNFDVWRNEELRFRIRQECCETLERWAYISDQGKKNLVPNFNGVAE